ncbi:hypothetical protein [Nitrosomonas ureae]|uniref:Uncharacterized protein n=1 Tax=Nitrosomonas ureae TaxID=44577 RepID=A0A1H9A4W0_9PROT|nr:hypothetical protein [Nitrosomonas ureae]SEP71762.1 hypothetical protein SAMN05421510_1002115 [Nitrosomonas ureae]
MLTKKNALREHGGNNNDNKTKYITKKFPPYGRRFDELRRNGLVPVQRVIVSTDWKLGAAYPRIVIPVDANIDKLIFSYLAGLPVQIVHHAGEAELVSNLIDAILKVKPKILTVFNFDVAQQNDPTYSASTLIHPAWEVIKNGL